MNDQQKQQLRDDLQFAIMKAERLSVLDPRVSPSSQKGPMDIKSLHDVFAVFGYSADDYIDRHDQCTMFTRIRHELDELLRDLSTNPKKYDNAILLRDRLRLVKREFVDTQGQYEHRRQEQEHHQFHKGVILSKKRCEAICDQRASVTQEEIAFKKNDLLKTHAVERDQLESFLRRLPAPHVKFSTVLLELKNTEKNLAKLRLFEDAKSVYVKADAMENDERAANAANFEKFKETKRALMSQKQQRELAELDEKLMEKRFSLTRSNNRARNVESQRVKNLQHDMRHAHALDVHDKKIFSTNATPVIRKHHADTASTFRGQQLLSSVQGRRLEVASLCAIHENEDGRVPHGSIVFN